MENNEEKTVNENTGVANANDDKLITILSYFGILWIVSYILYGNKKSEYNAFHLRQGLGLIILYFVVMILAYILAYIPILGWLVILGLYILLFVFWIMGVIGAAQGTQKPLPLVGKLIQDILKGIK
jgi:uncharacterized membrane protein